LTFVYHKAKPHRLKPVPLKPDPIGFKLGRPAAALVERLGWMAAAGCYSCLFLHRGGFRMQASASCFPPPAIRATACGLRLHDPPGSGACKCLSIVHKARNGRSDASPARSRRFRRRKPVRRHCGEIGKASRRRPTRTPPRNSDSRISDEDSEPLHSPHISSN